MAARYGVAGPRYASYPRPPPLGPFTAAQHAAAVRRSNAGTPTAPIALHVHSSFGGDDDGVARMYAQDAGSAERYLEALLREIDRQGTLFERRRPVEQLHFGTRTPTRFSDDQLSTILDAIARSFGSVGATRREYSINIDPADVDSARLKALARLGFTRIHIGVEDFDPDVQDATRRVHTPLQTLALLDAARTLGLRSTSFDLMYGLPRQTAARFARTLDRVVALRPDRVAVRGYEHLPDQLEAHRQIRAAELPGAGLRLELLLAASDALVAAGYVHLGMDHFVVPDDELALALRRNRLQRTVLGYGTRAGLEVLGLGMGGMSHIDGAFTQNARGFADYVAALAAGTLPTSRGILLTRDDRFRTAVIERILCGRDVPYGVLRVRFGMDFREYFRSALLSLGPAERDGLVERTTDRLVVTERGRFFLRALAMPFDANLVTSLVQSRRGG